MVKLNTIPIGQTPEDGMDRIAFCWDFYCVGCQQYRTAYIFESGHVIDVPHNARSSEKALILNDAGDKFINVYWSPEARNTDFRNSQEGIALIKHGIAQAHATQFHKSRNATLVGKG